MAISLWTEDMGTSETNDVLFELASVHTSRISAVSERERLASCIAGGDILDLCNYNPSYEELTVHDALNIRQVTAFFQKRGDLDVGINKRQAAVEKFIEAELLCKQTNEIFESRSRGEFFFSPRVEAVLHAAQRKITLILGDLPTLADLKLRFGPGATTQVKKKKASTKRKLSMPFSCSEDLLPILPQVLEELPKWVFDESESADDAVVSKSVPVEIHSGKLAFVRKTYKTDRSIVVEPMLNQMVQLGIGDYMSQQLRKAGVDLYDQSRNKRLALEGSLTGDLATLDLSSASDTISKALVLDLLPFDWFKFLAFARTSLIECDGVPVRMQKFSSMGNGFTFPLESLIFYALSWAATDDASRGAVSVYGDDIIVPVSAYPLLTEVLLAVGFIPNKDKSFASGPFRESCGGDYLRGIDIRPCYIKAALSGVSLFVLHNYYVRQHDSELAELVLNHIPGHLRRWGPDGYGDGHLVGGPSLRPHGRDRGWSGYTFETYTMKPKKDFEVLPGDRVYPFYSIYQGASPELLPERWSPSHRNLDQDSVQYGSPGHQYDRDGRLGVPIPGASAYKLIKIYTLSPLI